MKRAPCAIQTAAGRNGSLAPSCIPTVNERLFRMNWTSAKRSPILSLHSMASLPCDESFLTHSFLLGISSPFEACISRPLWSGSSYVDKFKFRQHFLRKANLSPAQATPRELSQRQVSAFACVSLHGLNEVGRTWQLPVNRRIVLRNGARRR